MACEKFFGEGGEDLENCAYLWKNPGYAPVCVFFMAKPVFNETSIPENTTEELLTTRSNAFRDSPTNKQANEQSNKQTSSTSNAVISGQKKLNCHFSL